MLKTAIILSLFITFMGLLSLSAQHCPPLIGAFLNNIQLRKSADSIHLNLNFIKEGGHPKTAYQIYLLVYLKENQSKIVNNKHVDPIDNPLTKVLSTQTISINTNNREQVSGFFGESYSYQTSINEAGLADEMIHFGNLVVPKPFRKDGFTYYKETFELAVYIPLLTSKHSNLPELPEDRHEWHFKEGALLFQVLPYQFKLGFHYLEPSKHSLFVQSGQNILLYE